MIEIGGIEWCAVHDSFAIEGYDWSQQCHASWDEDDEPCDLRPIFVKRSRWWRRT